MPSRAGTKRLSRNTSKEPLKDILMPGGREVGVRNPGASAEVRTVSKAEFEQLKSDLTAGAREVPAATNYEGKWYQRSDGTIMGVRESGASGTTIEVIEGRGSGVRNGYKVHRK